ncbi:MAG TPA: ferredoxin [Mycobacteriales bacterium]|jgi:ferredoxin|nr:ferredoxin [Cryptosporangiaceae bacterium]MDQ1678346.1 ferredoxin [Actinomycetota bacterium]HEV7756241.1 ferredoxin [Mycobacteriales bacterium]
MRVVVDHDRCQGAGLCALTAPEVFDQSEDDGTVLVLDPAPAAELHDAVRRAAGLCPNAVITVAD